MPLNKSVHIAQTSRLVGPITEYSASRGSSGFSNGPWSGTDPFNQLLDLRQGSLSIEEYATQFFVLADKVPFEEVFLKDIFRFGLSEPVKSWLPEGKFNVSLKDFMDYALMVAGSSFIVGVAEEERETRLWLRRRTHQNALTKWRPQQPVTSFLPFMNPVKPQLVTQSHTTYLLVTQSHTTYKLVTQSHTKSQLVTQSYITSQLVTQSYITSQLVTQSHTTSQLVTQSHTTSQLVIQSHTTSQLVIQSHTTSRLVIQSHTTSRLIFTSQVMSPLTFQSLFTSPLTFQSLFMFPLTFQSLFTSPLTIQNHITSHLISQSLVTSCLPHPDIQGQYFSILDWHPSWRIHRWCQYEQLVSLNQHLSLRVPMFLNWCPCLRRFSGWGLLFGVFGLLTPPPNLQRQRRPLWYHQRWRLMLQNLLR